LKWYAAPTGNVGQELPSHGNPTGLTGNVTAAASATGVEISVVNARDSREIDTAFATLARNRADAPVVGANPFFYGRRVQLVALATRNASSRSPALI
jgi:hypothetical protein